MAPRAGFRSSKGTEHRKPPLQDLNLFLALTFNAGVPVGGGKIPKIRSFIVPPDDVGVASRVGLALSSAAGCILKTSAAASTIARVCAVLEGPGGVFLRQRPLKEVYVGAGQVLSYGFIPIRALCRCKGPYFNDV